MVPGITYRFHVPRALLSAAAVLFALVLAAPAVACAHVPVLEPSRRSDSPPAAGDPYPAASRIAGPDRSRAIYGYLTADERFDAFSFEVTAPVTCDVSMIVPVRADTGAFSPRLRVIAGPPVTVMADVLRTVPPARPTFFEPFSLATFYDAGSTSLRFEAGRRYWLVVDAPAGQRAGPYALAFSGSEAFGADDWLATARDLPWIWFGGYADGPVMWDRAGVIALALALALVAGLARLRSARRGR